MALAVEDLLAVPDLPLKIDAARLALGLEAKEREKFRDEIEPHQKGEFINGEIFMHSPVRYSHVVASTLAVRLLSSYVSLKKEGVIVFEKAMCAFSRNDYEPDVAWFGPEKSRLINLDTVIHPVPDFIIEILSPGTKKHDRGAKFDDYAAHGVKEYWIVDADERTVEQYILPAGGGEYRLAEKLGHGDIAPASFPGLRIPILALFEDQANLDFLRELLTA
jgi:Uma2 family endonuclease